MTDNDYKNMILSHDKHIETLTHSVDLLASGVHETNAKLNDVIDVITQQNVLMERVDNLHNNVEESFQRAWRRLDKLDNATNEIGCNKAKEASASCSALDSKINDLEDEVNSLSTRADSFISATTIRWGIGLVLVYTLAFSSHVITQAHKEEVTFAAYSATTKEHISNIDQELKALSSLLSNDTENANESLNH